MEKVLHWKGRAPPAPNGSVAPPHKKWCIEHDQVENIAKELCEDILKGSALWEEAYENSGVIKKRTKCMDALEGPILRYSPIVYDAAVNNHRLLQILVAGFTNEVMELKKSVMDRNDDKMLAPSFFHFVQNYLLSGSQILDERGPDGKRFLLPGLGNSCAWPERVIGLLQSDPNAAIISWLEVVLWRLHAHYILVGTAAAGNAAGGSGQQRTLEMCRGGLISTIYAFVLDEVAELVLTHNDGECVPKVLGVFKAMNEKMRTTGESGPLLNYSVGVQAVLRIQAIRLRSQAWADEHFSLEQMGIGGKKVLAHYLGKHHAKLFHGEARAGAFAFLEKKGAIGSADLEKWRGKIQRGLTDEQLCRLL
jgi:hypothetical protein